MQVILQADVKNLGPKGKVVNVADGYARNYLLPRGLAVEASTGNVKRLEVEKAGEAQRKDRLLQEAKALGGKLMGVTVQVKTKAGEGGRLFGSVTNKEVAEILEQQTGLTVDKRKFELKQPIKALGVYPINVKIHPAVVVELKLEVVAE
ncbi:MAG: 50S ribosomal protein L9 [Heliobacteriaceae bacterium]|nr:50S ribosomal protein L9 [Heliobacteriaceae bacterium]MDD4588247.1 50S ribosomal protein L9 [Heliobacteriaceae bacterium]